MTYEIDSKVDIGEFFVAPGIEEGRVWIGKQDGEGGDFVISELEEVIREFYDKNF